MTRPAELYLINMAFPWSGTVTWEPVNGRVDGGREAAVDIVAELFGCTMRDIVCDLLVIRFQPGTLEAEDVTDSICREVAADMADRGLDLPDFLQRYAPDDDGTRDPDFQRREAQLAGHFA